MATMFFITGVRFLASVEGITFFSLLNDFQVANEKVWATHFTFIFAFALMAF
jgi:hypothetical protein